MWDLDLLGTGSPTVDEVVRAAQDICDVAAEDGIESTRHPCAVRRYGARAGRAVYASVS